MADTGRLQQQSGPLQESQLQSLLQRLAALLDQLEKVPPTPKEEEGLMGLFSTIGKTLEGAIPVLGPLLAML